MWLLDVFVRFNSNIDRMESGRDIEGLARVLRHRRDPSLRARAAQS